MIIAVDFDGTIVEHKYPAIGKEKIFAFETLKSLQKDGHLLILWTIRSGKELDAAIEYCQKRGIEFYAVNRTHPEEEINDNMSRKVNADIFIDDRNVGGFMGWGEIWQWINKEASKSETDRFKANYQKAQRRTLCGFLQAIFCNK
ncbi:BT0820 family HAD-type phosphatase [Carboxylicivirga sp. M1479]|uniref:BT0820 family HAD-type phosphatase n=1 Tax=Carboxylicivirga sp. M1479 TaxID=2594476 RepID=UPI001178B973|nr:hydrolase [Carboxylicivirga sp. M1479]TRX70894.1 hydrolase [Carboxylicivirga sp. M1479]